MTSIGETLSPAIATKPVKSKFGSGVFSPNASIGTQAQLAVYAGYLLIISLGWLFLPKLIPNPIELVTELTELATEQGLITELYSSLVTSLQAISISAIVGLLIAYAATIPAFRPVGVALSKFRFLSLAGWSFLFTVYIGGGQALKLSLLVFGIAPFFITSMLDVVLQVPTEKIDYVRTLRTGRWRAMYEQQILGTLGSALDAVRQNAAMGWLMLTMVEGMVRSGGGIGKMMLDQEKHFTIAGIFAIQTVFLLCGLGQDWFIAWLKTVIAPWSALTYTKK